MKDKTTKDLSHKSIELSDNNMGRLFQRAGRTYSERALSLLHERGFKDVKLSHSALFANLDLSGTQITTIAERAGMTKQAMGQLASDLEAKGYIRKSKDPEDRRAFIIQFTKLGEKALHAAYDIKVIIENEFKALLGRKNFAELQKTVLKLVANYD